MSHMEKKMAFPSGERPMFELRGGEIQLEHDPATAPPDAGIVFIGTVASPWKRREDCPKNMGAAREKGGGGRVVVDLPYREGLRGLDAYSHAVLLTWLHHAPRDLIVQKPRHAGQPSGTFALRSPARPNPVGLHVVRILNVDVASGTIEIEAVDVLDSTPVIDIKPYFASADSVPDATRAARDEA
jgi:tRNA-Thr(GGU) m(6)t(6)A37 methyltransferase TsaA